MLFREFFLLIENTTNSQFLKQEKNKKYFEVIKNEVIKFITDHIHGINQNNMSRYVNWFIKELIVQNIQSIHVSAVLENWWENIGDWIANNLQNNQLQSRFNLVNFTYANAVELSEQWHAQMKASLKRGKEGRTVVDLSDVPGFKGWKWVALDAGSCSTEGDAMGHCGNAGGASNDNILSLRDTKNVPHLTFINNKGVLGEMKGRGNSKPTIKYHPAIIKLLLSNEIGSIKGGGYAAANNFKFDDLTKEEQKYIKDRKPYMNLPDEFMKDREKIITNLHKKVRSTSINKSNIDNIGQVVKDLIDDNIKPEIMYDERPDEEVPEKIRNQYLWKFYSELLNETYRRAKKSRPEDLFAWMDKAIEAMVTTLVATDEKTFKGLSSENMIFFDHISNIIKLHEMAFRLNQNQPEILQGSPQRSRFKNYKDYVSALERFLNNQGYDLPGYRPDNNMVSYEFDLKVLDEIKKNSSVMIDMLNRANDSNNDGKIKSINQKGRLRRLIGNLDTLDVPKGDIDPNAKVHKDDLDRMVDDL